MVPMPTAWTWDMVHCRLISTAQILRRMPPAKVPSVIRSFLGAFQAEGSRRDPSPLTPAEIMGMQETGGTKRPRSGGRVAVPIKAKRNKRDIIPKGQRPGALRGKPKIFKVANGSGAGIMRRIGHKRYPVEILYWLKHGVTVKPAFGFKGTTSDTVSKRFGPNFVESLSQAMGHRG